MGLFSGASTRVAACTALLLCGGTAATVMAQGVLEGLPREPQTGDYRRAGPFFFKPSLRVKALGWDDNVFLEREDRQGDFVATLGPEVRGVLRLGSRAWASFHGAVDLNGYARNSALDHLDNSRGVQVTSWAGDLRLVGAYDDERALRRPSSEIDQRVRVDRSQARLAALYEITTASTVEMSVARTVEGYERVNGVDYDSLLGHVDTTRSLAGRHRIGALTWAVLELSGSAREGHAAAGRRDLQQSLALVGLDFDPGAVLQGSMRIGLVLVSAPDPLQSERREYRGAGGRGDLSARITSRSQARLVFARDFTPSGSQSSRYFRNDTAEISLLRELTPRVAGEAGFARGWNVYPDPDPARRRDRMNELFAGARVRLGSQAVLGIRVGRWSRDSNVQGEDRDRFVISQSITVPL